MANSSIVTDGSGNKVAVDVTSDSGRRTERWEYKSNLSPDPRGSFLGTQTNHSDGSSSFQTKKDGAKALLGLGKF